MKSALIPRVDKLIIKIGKNITKDDGNNNLLNDFKSLLNTLKIEAKCIGCREIINTLGNVSRKINQNHGFQSKPLFVVYSDIFATLIEQYIKIIDIK